jgi:hypothetical protein
LPVNSGTLYTGTYGGRIYPTFSQYLFKGDQDELRISDVVRSADWIKFEYYNMSSVNNELSWDNQESI